MNQEIIADIIKALTDQVSGVEVCLKRPLYLKKEINEYCTVELIENSSCSMGKFRVVEIGEKGSVSKELYFDDITFAAQIFKQMIDGNIEKS